MLCTIACAVGVVGSGARGGRRGLMEPPQPTETERNNSN